MKQSKREILPAALLILLLACNRDFDARIDTSVEPDTEVHQSPSQNKVLYVVADGGIGKVIVDQSVRDNVYPNLHELSQTGIFSGASLSDKSNVEATTYADMFTGVRMAKHGVADAKGSNHLDQYHSFVENLALVNANLKTSAFVQSDFVFNNLVNKAVTKQLLSTDQAVETAATADLATTSSSVVVAQYMGLKNAGDANGYGPDSEAYLNALVSFDHFLGRLLEAIRARNTLASENWVIIIASNKGGDYPLAENEDDGSDFSEPERNGFLIISNPNFNLDYYPLPSLRDYSASGVSPEELGPADRQGVIDAETAEVYNMGTSGDYTIQFKANISNRSVGNLIPSIMSKSSSNGGASPTQGWSMILHADNGRTNWSFRFNGTANTGPSYDLNVWNTFTATVYDSAGGRYIRTFLNGEGVNPSSIAGKNGTTTSQLIIGGGPSYGGNTFRGRICDVRIYNVALPESYIVGNYCKTYVNWDEDYADHLIGYWPGLGMSGREASEKIFVDYSPNKNDVKFGSAAVWSGINLTAGDHICPVYPDQERSKIPYSVDIPRFIYTWLGVLNLEPYHLDSKLLTPSYKSTGE